MKNYAIVADSTCDLTLEIREKYDIDYIKMGYVIDDVTYPASLDWESHSAHDFYELMRGGKYVRTVQIAREDTIAVFKKHLDLGRILSISPAPLPFQAPIISEALLQGSFARNTPKAISSALTLLSALSDRAFLQSRPPR